MAIYGESLTIQYIAWDTVNNAPKTGDVANHTLRWVKDGVAAAPTNAPSEVDAANAPGLYKLTLTATETQCWVGTLCGKSSSSGVVLMPITLTFERLPTAAPGDTNGLPIIGVAPLTNLDAKISEVKAQTDKLQFVGTDVKATLDNEAVIVGAYATNMSPSEQIQSLGYTSARAGKLDNLDAAVSSRLKADDYTAPDNASIAAIKGQTDKLQFNASNQVIANAANLDNSAIASAVWSNATRTLTAFGFNVALTSDYDRAKNALSVSEYVAPDNTSIAAIKTQTDKLRFDSQNNVYAAVSGIEINAEDVAAAIWDVGMSEHNAPGTAGAKLNVIEARTANIAAGTEITVVQPVAQDQTLTLVRGDDYSVADGRALQWTGYFPDLTDAAITFTIASRRDYRPIVQSTCTAAPGTEGAWTITAELTSAQTSLLNPNDTSYVYDVEAVIASRHVTLVRGRVEVLPDVNRT